jgi:hypothetical protein
MYCPDNYDAFSQHDAQQEREERKWLARLPECVWCGEKIKSEMCYDIGCDALVCEECMEGVKTYTENHMRG